MIVTQLENSVSNSPDVKDLLMPLIDRSGHIYDRMNELGLRLPEAPHAVGAYIPVIQVGQLVMTSGQLPTENGELVAKGKVGSEVSVEKAQQAARVCVLNALAQIEACLGSLNQVQRIVRVEGFVESADGFTSQPSVLNAASELLLDIFGEAGRHTRFAVGSNELPLNASVELSVWAEVKS